MIPIAKPYLGQDEVRAAKKAILSGWVSQGPKVLEFEKKFSAYTRSKYACAVSSCTAALHLALLAVGVKPNDIVVTVSHSFIATANTIRYCQAEPVFVDVDLDTFNISVEHLEKTLENYSKKKKRIGALLVVHQMGMPCNLPKILKIAKKFKVPVVEDAACSIGSQITMDKGKTWDKIGKSHGDAACFSFHPRKVITTGEGGMVTTNNAKIDKSVRLLRHQGMDVSDLKRHTSKKVCLERYPVLGYNYRMTDIQASVGVEQLKKIDRIVARRRVIANLYHKGLSDVAWVKLPQEPSYAKTNWQSFPVRILKGAPLSRNQLMQYLLNKGVASRSGIMNSHCEKPYQNKKILLPVSEKARLSVILLPLFYALKNSEVQQIIKVIKNV